jgi:hypothetical protein
VDLLSDTDAVVDPLTGVDLLSDTDAVVDPLNG